MIALLVVLSAAALLVLGLVETAFGLLMRLPERFEAERESENAALATYLEDPLKFFVPARLVRGALLIVLVVALAQPIGNGFAAALALAASSLAISIGVSHLLPALMVRRAPERFLDLLLPAFTAVANVTGPLTALIIGWTGASSRRAPNGNGDGTTHEPVGLVDEATAATGDENLLRSVVDFGETLVREVMTPRPDVVAIEADATIDDLRRLVREQEYSRLPVYTGNLDNIVGLVVVKDLIQSTPEADAGRHVRDLMRPAAFVPETKRVVELLREFQQGRFQLAIVVDEYGGTAGLVTVEDVVEELVGEIRDEYDIEADPIVRESEDSYVFSAKVGIGDLVDRLGVAVEDDGEFETVGGFVLARVGRVPAAGEQFQFDDDGLAVDIIEAEGRRIHKVRIRRQPRTTTSQESQ